MVILKTKLLPKNVVAITLYPFIFVNKIKKINEYVVNHEKIHLRQQIELLILPFYFWYLSEYLIRLIVYKDTHKAYMNISFEKEAYENEGNLEYLDKRKALSFLKYV